MVNNGNIEKFSVAINSEAIGKNVLALGNALPGPIATKMAGYIGFEVAGVVGGS